jgi:hypothetical protein
VTPAIKKPYMLSKQRCAAEDDFSSFYVAAKNLSAAASIQHLSHFSSFIVLTFSSFFLSEIFCAF